MQERIQCPGGSVKRRQKKIRHRHFVRISLINISNSHELDWSRKMASIRKKKLSYYSIKNDFSTDPVVGASGRSWQWFKVKIQAHGLVAECLNVYALIARQLVTSWFNERVTMHVKGARSSRVDR